MKKLISILSFILIASSIWAAGVPFTGSIDAEDIDGLTSEKIAFDNAISGMAADDVKAALDELHGLIGSSNTAGINWTTFGVLETTSGLDAGYVIWQVSGVTYKQTGENVQDWVLTYAQPLEATLTDISDGTISENLVNTSNPWADNEVADTLTIGASGSVDDGAIPSGVTRDSEWNTVAKIETATSANLIINTEIDTVTEINALTTDQDFLVASDISSTVQGYNATLAAVAGSTYTGDNAITTLGTISTGVWNSSTKIDADYLNILALDTTITERDNTDYIVLHDSSGVKSVKMTVGNFVTGLGGPGGSIVFDIGDDGGNDSTAIGEIATNGDTNAIFSEPSADKVYIDLSKDWPKADVADVASTGDSATAFFSTGTLEDGLLAAAVTRDAEWDTSLEILNAVTDEVGTGALVFANTPTLVTPVLGAATGTSLALGADPADTGTIRLPNAGYIYSEADAASTDISVIGVDSGEIVQIGASGASGVTITPATTITGALTASSTVGVATSMNPDAAAGATLGTTALEWTGLYLADDTGLYLGLGQDWLVAYDELTSNALEFTHTAGADADVTFDLNDNAAASTFTISNSDGTYAANLSVDGNISTGGTITSTATGDSYLELANNTTLAASGNRLYFEGNVLKVSENGTERTVLSDTNSATITGTTWDFSGVTNFEVPNAAAPTTDAFGEIAADNNAWAASRGALQTFDGTASTWVVATLTTDTPENGQVPKWNTGGTITWEADNSAGSPTIDAIGNAAAAADVDFDIAETMTWNFTGAFTTGTQFLIEQKTGNPSGGTLFEVKGADANPVLASLGDGTNKINISNTGALTLGGTASITGGDDNLIAGGITFDSSPGVSGDLGYAANVFSLMAGATSETLTITGAENLFTFASGTGATFVFTPNTTITGDLTVTGNDLIFGNAETISNATNGVLAITSPSTTVSGSMDVTGAVTGASFAPTRTAAMQYIQLYEGTGSGDNYQTFTTPALAANVAYTLPNALPASTGYVLSCTDAGVMSWAADATGSATAWSAIGDPAADATVAFAGYEQDITSTLDEASHSVLTITNTDADRSADTTILELADNDSGDVNAIWMKLTSDADGTPAIDFQISQIATATAAQIKLGATGVLIYDDADGAITFKGNSAGSDEDLTLNLDDTANTGVFSSGSDLATLDFGAIALYTTGGLSGKVAIEDKTSTGNITAEPYCYGGIVTNTGAGGAIVLTLPDAVKGMSLKVILTVAQDVDINPQNGEQILVKTNAAGDALSSDATIGSACVLIAVSDTQWMATTEGTWTDAN